MEKLWPISVAPDKSKEASDENRWDDGQTNDQSPIRKQAHEDRQRYMREYMRAYRRMHPGLSTPYVRKFRAKQRDIT